MQFGSKAKETSKKDTNKKEEKTFLERLARADQKLLQKFPDPRKPKPPPKSGYNLFIKQMFETDGASKIVEIAPLWKELNEAEKETYNEEAKEALEAYKQEMEKYTQNEDQSLQKWLKIVKELDKKRPAKSGYMGFIRENRKLFAKGTRASEITPVKF